MAKCSDIENENIRLKERIENSNRALLATREELDRHESRTAHMDRVSRESTVTAKNYETQIKAFREQLASMLSDGYVRVEPYEEPIRERIRHLLLNHSDRTSVSMDNNPRMS